MSRPSFPGRDSGIVDLSAYLGSPAQPLLRAAIPETPRRSRRAAWLREAGTTMAALSVLLSSAALLITLRAESAPVATAPARIPEKSTKVQAGDGDLLAPPPQVQAGDGDLLAPPPRPSPAAPDVQAGDGDLLAPPPRPSRAAAPAAPLPEPDRGPRTLDELMNGATATTLPSTPSRDEVARVLRGLSSRVAQCRPQDMEPTTVTTRVTIDGATGRVARATVDGDQQWSATGACIVETLSAARFSPFARDRFEVQFPYRL